MNERTARWWIALAGMGGGLLIAVVQSSYGGGFSPRLGVQGPDAFYGPDPYSPLIPTVATVLALCLLRWWPLLLTAGGLLCVPIAWPDLVPDPNGMTFYHAFGAAFPFLVVGALGAAQRLLCTGAPGLGAATASLVVGFGLFGRALPGSIYQRLDPAVLSSPTIEVVAPADPVLLPAWPAAEATAAVLAALDNIRQHAGAGTRAWILLEDEDGGIRVTVRDDGDGFEPQRLDEAARAGRLGVEQSIRGRIRDLGGTTAIKSRPGRGTEVELWIPRRR